MKLYDLMIKDRKFKYFLLCVVFVFMLVLNSWTYYIADDYIYMFSFATHQRIESVSDIFPSINQHYYSLNGRLAPHFLVQLFLMAPKGVFNFINALMFCLMLVLVEKMANLGKGRNNLILLAPFCLFWLLQPAFGQVYLWLDGSINYMWGAMCVGFFTLPFAKRLTGNGKPFPFIKAILFALFGVITGNFSENASSAVIALTFFMLCYMVIHRIKCLDLIIAWVCAWGGFILLAFSPAGAAAKVNSFSAEEIALRFTDTLVRLQNIAWLLVLWAVLMIICRILGKDRQRMFVSSMYFFGGLFANFVLIFSTYYPERSMCAVTFFIVCALFTLIWELNDDNTAPYIAAAGLIVLLSTMQPIGIGCRDIWNTNQQNEENLAYIAESIENGEKDIVLPTPVTPETKYSAYNGLKYMDIYETENWPNPSAAKYFGLDTILGNENTPA